VSRLTVDKQQRKTNVQNQKYK